MSLHNSQFCPNVAAQLDLTERMSGFIVDVIMLAALSQSQATFMPKLNSLETH